MKFVGKFANHPFLTGAALCIGVAVVVADTVLFSRMLERPPDLSEPDVLFIKALLAALPFLWLAYRGSRRWLPWAVGLGLTIWLWWRWLQAGVAYQRAPDGSGVDMAFAFIVLVSPVFIGAACVWIDEILKQRAPAKP